MILLNIRKWISKTHDEQDPWILILAVYHLHNQCRMILDDHLCVSFDFNLPLMFYYGEEVDWNLPGDLQQLRVATSHVDIRLEVACR